MNSRILIPAAGFGKRVGSPIAKELLPHPKTGRPMIAETVDKAGGLGSPLVITRAEKRDLIEYLAKNNIEYQVIDETREWPDTILAAKKYWLDTNLILLPDTDYSPISITSLLLNVLDFSETTVSLGVFKVDDFNNWGMIDLDSDTLCIADKPSFNKNNTLAWGLIAFCYSNGDTLFQAISNSNKDKLWKETGLKYKFFKLEHFSDLTRP